MAPIFCVRPYKLKVSLVTFGTTLWPFYGLVSGGFALSYYKPQAFLACDFLFTFDIELAVYWFRLKSQSHSLA